MNTNNNQADPQIYIANVCRMLIGNKAILIHPTDYKIVTIEINSEPRRPLP